VRIPNTGSATTTTYLYGLGLIAETDNGGSTFFYLSDGLGSTSDVVESDGDVANTYTYDVWGAIRSSSGSVANQFDFTGEQADHNANRGLVYLRARFYDPALGRFLSRDPLATVPGWRGQAYGYANGNPVIEADPSGLDPEASGTPVPGEDDNGPEAFPFLAVGTEDLFNRCLWGYDYCKKTIARQFQKRRGGPIGMYREACRNFFRRCVSRANKGDPNTYFDFDGVRQNMQDMSLAPQDAPSIWDLLPNTGTGGYLPTPTPVLGGAAGCSR
jgi:RHS repeat-associated protein